MVHLIVWFSSVFPHFPSFSIVLLVFSPSRRYGASRRETWKRVCFILPMNSRRVWTSLSQRSKTVLRAPILLKPYKRTRQNLTEIVGDGGGGWSGPGLAETVVELACRKGNTKAHYCQNIFVIN